MLALTGVDLTKVPGINSLNVLYLVGEIGLDMTRWKSSKQFACWLGLCPGNKVSGGKRISSKSKPSANRAAGILRMAANTLSRSETGCESDGLVLFVAPNRAGRCCSWY